MADIGMIKKTKGEEQWYVIRLVLYEERDELEKADKNKAEIYLRAERVGTTSAKEKGETWEYTFEKLKLKSSEYNEQNTYTVRTGIVEVKLTVNLVPIYDTQIDMFN